MRFASQTKKPPLMKPSVAWGFSLNSRDGAVRRAASRRSGRAAAPPVTVADLAVGPMEGEQLR